MRVGDFEVDSYFRFRGVACSLTDFLVGFIKVGRDSALPSGAQRHNFWGDSCRSLSLRTAGLRDQEPRLEVPQSWVYEKSGSTGQSEIITDCFVVCTPYRQFGSLKHVPTNCDNTVPSAWRPFMSLRCLHYQRPPFSRLHMPSAANTIRIVGR